MGFLRVQAVAELSATQNDIPEEFIMSKPNRPSSTTFTGPTPDLPVIDLANPDRESVTSAIAEASREWGIFQVVNHGVPEELIKKLQLVGNDFFQLPIEEKEAYAANPSSGSLEGYGTQFDKDLEGKKSWVDFLFHIVWPQSRINYKVWPQNPASYRKVNEEYTKCMLPLVDEMFGNLSISLGLEKGALKEAAGGDEMKYMMKINYYPPCPRPDLALGITPHTDMSTLTIILPDQVPGLQVSKDEHWIDVKYVPNALIVHIGDQIEIMSNGVYKSVLHRTTVNKEKARLSWPLFVEPPEEKEIGPLPQLITGEKPAKYKCKKFKDYQYCKINKLPQ
ncbi:Flavonol synthase [Rhynchospora pubera]|uniref:anthocyanidin synthase n=1 Tax=Rhynchospora pubera TaxID=906938 RepID=A0AAV8GVP6_9POAL|nr:Flavonol synthase [Rhynchospora pubera]